MVKNDDPHRAERSARIRFVNELMRVWVALVRADELHIYRLSKVGYAWRA